MITLHEVNVAKLSRDGFNHLVNVAKWINDDNQSSFVQTGWVETKEDAFVIDGGLCTFLFGNPDEAQEFIDYVNQHTDKEYCIYKS
jgi:hypothetical protein